MGLKRRRIAHTQLNTESSRSHSVLSMRLIQYHNDIPLSSLVRSKVFFILCFLSSLSLVTDKRRSYN